MKIASVSAAPFAYVFSEEHVSKYLRGQSFSCLFVRVESDDGLIGYGEVCDSFGCNYPLTLKSLIEEALAPLLKNQDTAPVEFLGQMMRRCTCRRLGDSGAVMQAISGVEIALWDLFGKAESKPVSQLLGATRKQIPVYASGSYLDEGPAEWHCSFYRPCLEKGIKAIKVRTGTEYRRDLETLRELRRLLGDEVQLLVDGGRYYSFFEALEISRALDDIGVLFFEEPLPQYLFEAISNLVQKTSVPIAYGGHLFNLHEFQDCLVHHRAGVIQPDAAICGGIAEAKKVAVLGEAAGISVVPHAAAGPLSLAANLHFAVATANIPMLEYCFPLQPVWQAVLSGSRFFLDEIEDGALRVPDSPGLGVAFDENSWSELARSWVGKKGAAWQ